MYFSPAPDCRGHAMLEFSMVVVVLLTIAFSALEGARILQDQQNATALVRELAGLPFRQCVADKLAVGTVRYDPQACFASTVSNEFKAKLNKIAPNGEFIVSLYSYDGVSVTRDAIYQDMMKGPTFVSKFSPQNFQAELNQLPAQRSNAVQALTLYNTMVIAEISIRHDGLDFIPRWLIPFDIQSVYAAALL